MEVELTKSPGMTSSTSSSAILPPRHVGSDGGAGASDAADDPCEGSRRRVRAHHLLLACAVALLVTLALLVRVAASADAAEARADARCQQAEPPSYGAGAVAADHPRCSQMGVDRLREGGNAVDAAVSTALCQGVLRPYASGLGGGAFLLIRRANGSAEVIDARETAPAGAHEAMFVGRPGASLTGGAAVAVPSELAGLHLAWARHGRLPWATLVAPVAALAERFEVDAQLARAIEAHAERLRAFPRSAATYLPGDRPPAAGSTLRNEALAETLRAIARDGANALRVGPLAEAIVADVVAAGGALAAADLAAYRPAIRAPLVATVAGLTVLGAPPPSSGAAVLQAL